MASSPGVHPGELSRRISELDVSTLHRPSITEPENGSNQTVEELTSPRPGQENHNGLAVVDGGVKTPPEVPAPPPSPHNEASNSDGALADIDTNAKALGDEKPKKKKKKKTSGKNKKPVPTGFEEFYADAPVTPGEFDEEKDVYNTALPFHERIQTCIQRYRKRRNLDSIRSDIFTKYLMLGGIEASATKPFTGGLDQDTLDNSTAQEIGAIQATDFIRSGQNNSKYYDPSDPEYWVVDFEGIAKGFFSSTALKHFLLDNEQGVKSLCGVIRNFLNYVLLHTVCPEYTEDVMAARGVCDMAEMELNAILRLRGKFPGPFNTSASTLYGRLSQGMEEDEIETGSSSDGRDMHLENLRLRIVAAERIFKTGVAFEGTADMFKAVDEGNINIVKTEARYVEIVQIDRAMVSTVDKYSTLKNHLDVPGTLNALGKVHVKHWDGPELFAEDMTDDEEEHPAPSAGPFIETFWLEDSILQHCFLGMKLGIEVTELDIGIKVIEGVLGLFCSFYMVLPNERVIDNWKEPTPNTRPPPTEDNPDAEEEAMDADMERAAREDEKRSGEAKTAEVNAPSAKLAKS